MDRIGRFIQAYVRFVLRALLMVSLTLLYVIGFAVTYLAFLLFDRATLLRRSGAGDSFWIAARGYEPDMEECSHSA